MTELRTIDIRIEIHATPDRVYKALTDEKELKAWFASFAKVSVQQGIYDFWGPSVPEAFSEAEGKHPVLGYVANQSLKYSWTLREQKTIVDINIASIDSEKTSVIVTHEGVPFLKPGESSISDFWSICLENLRNWIERDEEGVQFDFSKTPHGEAKVVIDIEAPKEEVFDALINPTQLDRYIGKSSEISAEIGGKYNLGWDTGGPLKILDLVPNEKLAYSWVYPDQPESVATWTLESSDGKTRLMVVHSGFASDRPCEDYQAGWAAYLTWIKGLVEGDSKWTAPRILSNDYSYTLS